MPADPLRFVLISYSCNSLGIDRAPGVARLRRGMGHSIAYARFEEFLTKIGLLDRFRAKIARG
jgi:hypothetical protein